MNVKEIPLDRIFVTKNVRFDTDDELGELIASTEKYGQLQPIGVYPRGARYELVWGHRRFRAAQANNEPTIAANILQDIAESSIPILKLQENLVRKPLSTEEILAAADEIKRRNPALKDSQIDVMIGKRPGYLSYHRSVRKSYEWLAQKGLKKEQLSALKPEELREMRQRMEACGKEREVKGRKKTFHRGDRTPKNGFDIMAPKGPNVVVICASATVKERVLSALKQLKRKTA